MTDTPLPADAAAYRLADPSGVLTPALLIYPAHVAANIAATVALLGGDPDRWRPHIKTAKIPAVIGMLLDAGVRCFKCATTLELRTLAERAAPDVLFAFPPTAASARRVAALAAQFPATAVSALLEDRSQLALWRGSQVGLFIDLNPGMDRTGALDHAAVVDLAGEILAAGQRFRGLHWYDGHLGHLDHAARETEAQRGYAQVLALIARLAAAGIAVPELVTAGTPTLAASAVYPPFSAGPFRHRASPGTTVYCDVQSLSALPPNSGFRPAAIVLSTVVSLPRAGRMTCDAGHKAVSADAGVPTCAVLGQPDWQPRGPSEEHLPIDAPPAALAPRGTAIYLVPRHICPTVNNFDAAAFVVDGQIIAVEPVAARGHEPLFR